MHEQGLAGEGFGSPVEAVGHLGAVQAQEFADALWSLAERVPGCSIADVEESFARGEILRVHTMRPTWHLVTASDICWVQALTAPRVHQANRYVYRRVGLDEATAARSNEALVETLSDGEPRTRRELGQALEDAGVEDATGIRMAHLVMHAELDALLCSGPRRGKQHTYALVSDRAPHARELSAEAALAELTLRYFTGHGPATAGDFAWWSGLTRTQARRGLELVDGGLEWAEDGDGTRWYAARRAAADAGPAGCHLIPTYDELNVGYQAERILELEPAILLDGVRVGRWKRKLDRDAVEVEVTLSAPLNAAGERALQAAVERLGASLGPGATLTRR
jgi:hypothetical protein